FVNTVYVANENLLIPNLFSPNGDGISDVFTVKVDNPVRFQATITNTRGEVLYRWTNAAEGWDGRINGNNIAAEGVYFYIISAEFESGNVVQRKGTLTLVRD
ncbi:MAG TPA: gliding motility-associated C-terminal domain-containing protein, partial [Bacteroidales bacterium]|nr:gliding motility-associated C-terminal domain-containing protein [Bacteroidales bacterium]